MHLKRSRRSRAGIRSGGGGATRMKWAAMTKRPGKFEGEAAYVPYFWDAFMNGMADDDDGETLTFRVTDADRVIFPELRRVKKVRIYERSDGFVCEA